MKNNNRGFIKLIILIIVGIFLLSYFKIDLRSLFNSDLTQSNFRATWSFIQEVWYDYVKTPIIFALNWAINLLQ